MLARMFSGDWGLQRKGDAYFIDRSGDLFEVILVLYAAHFYSVGLLVTRAITITARSAPALDGEALHMNAYHTSNLIHVLGNHFDSP